MSPAHGEEGHQFTLYCEACHDRVKARMRADFLTMMAKQGVSKQDALMLYDKARAMGAELRGARAGVWQRE